MAAETGISQPQISLVVGGKRSPGPRFLAGLAKIPRINIEWLHTGVGEPFAAAGVADQPTGGRSLPIASCPLPGSPQVNAGLLSGASFPVAESYFKESRYFYAVQKADPVVRAGLDIRPGDLLLFETDPAFWRPNLGVLHGKLCVLKLRTGSGTVCVLARAKPLAGRLEPTFEVFGGPYERDSAASDDESKLSDKDRECYERHSKFPRLIDWTIERPSRNSANQTPRSLQPRERSIRSLPAPRPSPPTRRSPCGLRPPRRRDRPWMTWPAFASSWFALMWAHEPSIVCGIEGTFATSNFSSPSP